MTDTSTTQTGYRLVQVMIEETITREALIRVPEGVDLTDPGQRGELQEYGDSVSCERDSDVDYRIVDLGLETDVRPGAYGSVDGTYEQD